MLCISLSTTRIQLSTNLLIAKIDAERKPLDGIVFTADLAATLFCGMGSRDHSTRGLVELIGIEPTTPCLQSRCSPN